MLVKSLSPNFNEGKIILKCDLLRENGPLHFQHFNNVLAWLAVCCHLTMPMFLLIQNAVQCSQNMTIHLSGIELIQLHELCNIFI